MHSDLHLYFVPYTVQTPDPSTDLITPKCPLHNLTKISGTSILTFLYLHWYGCKENRFALEHLCQNCYLFMSSPFFIFSNYRQTSLPAHELVLNITSFFSSMIPRSLQYFQIVLASLKLGTLVSLPALGRKVFLWACTHHFKMKNGSEGADLMLCLYHISHQVQQNREVQ